MARATVLLQPIAPEQLYTAETAARCLGCSSRWLRETFILSGKLRCIPMGRTYAFTGGDLIRVYEIEAEECTTPAMPATVTAPAGKPENPCPPSRSRLSRGKVANTSSSAGETR